MTGIDDRRLRAMRLDFISLAERRRELREMLERPSLLGDRRAGDHDAAAQLAAGRLKLTDIEEQLAVLDDLLTSRGAAA